MYTNKEIWNVTYPIFLGLLAQNVINVWGIERSVFFNGREKWAKGFENQRV